MSMFFSQQCIGDHSKLIISAASRRNPSRISNAYYLRNSLGDIIYAKASEIEPTTNIQAEAKAILEAYRHCEATAYTQVTSQTDSMLLKKVITRVWKLPWSIIVEIQEIQNIIASRQTTIQHIMREEKKLADFLANQCTG